MGTITYTVRGKDHFPIDMLRYDDSTLTAPEDTAWAANDKIERELSLTIHGPKRWATERLAPSIDRWASFEWAVTDISWNGKFLKLPRCEDCGVIKVRPEYSCPGCKLSKAHADG